MSRLEPPVSLLATRQHRRADLVSRGGLLAGVMIRCLSWWAGALCALFQFALENRSVSHFIGDPRSIKTTPRPRAEKAPPLGQRASARQLQACRGPDAAGYQIASLSWLRVIAARTGKAATSRMTPRWATCVAERRWPSTPHCASHGLTRSMTTGTGRQTVLQTGECCWA
jgi:hypothetical protein